VISLFEQRDQLLALERRRQEIAAQQAAAQHAPAVAAQIAASLAGAIHAGGYAPAAALKAGEPDIAKRRKGKHREHREGRDLETDPLTDAHETAAVAGAAAKNYHDRGITPGPAEGTMPGRPEPENFDRGYLEDGHGAESPQAERPRTNPNPVPSAVRGVPVPIQMSSAPMAAGIPHHVTQGLSMGSPSDK
jgi:hypothetical protein